MQYCFKVLKDGFQADTVLKSSVSSSSISSLVEKGQCILSFGSWSQLQREVKNCYRVASSENVPSHLKISTVKILKFGTPQTIAIIVLKIEKFDVTLH